MDTFIERETSRDRTIDPCPTYVDQATQQNKGVYKLCQIMSMFGITT